MPPTEKEKQQKMQEKFQAILSLLLREEENKYCVDCDAKGPRWASWNIGVFLCIRCAGIHRNLGVHISKVKSVNLDQWTAEQIASMQAMGNAKARSIYEKNLSDGFRRSQTDSAMEQFIRSKYEQRKWIDKEWVPHSIKVTSDLVEDDSQKDKRKTSKGGPEIKINLNPIKQESTVKKNTKPNNPPASVFDTKPTESVKTDSFFSDPVLLDFEANFEANAASLVPETKEALKTSDFIDDSNTNFFSINEPLPVSTKPQISSSNSSVTATTTTTTTANDLGLLMGDLDLSQNQSSSNKKIDKDSILALYGKGNVSNSHKMTASASSHNIAPTNNNMFQFNANMSNANLIGKIMNSPGTQQQNAQFNQLNLFMTQSAATQKPASNLNTQNAFIFNDSLFDNQPNKTNSASNVNSFNQFNQANLFGNMMVKNDSTTLKPASTELPNIGNTLISDLWQ